MPLPEGRKPIGSQEISSLLKSYDDSIKRMIKNRNFPDNTCPASRHVQMMAEALMEDGRYPMFDDDPEHCAESIASVVSSLYQARTFLKSLGYDWRVSEDGNVEWYKNDNNDGWYDGRAARNNMSSPGDKNYED